MTDVTSGESWETSEGRSTSGKRKRARAREHGTTRARVAALYVGAGTGTDVELIREAEVLTDDEFAQKWFLSVRAARRLRASIARAHDLLHVMVRDGELAVLELDEGEDEQYMHRLFCGDPAGGIARKPPSKENTAARCYNARFVSTSVLEHRRPRGDGQGTLARVAGDVVFYRPPQARLLAAISAEKRERLCDAFRSLRSLVEGQMGRFTTQELSRRYSYGLHGAMQKGERGLLNSWRTAPGVSQSHLRAWGERTMPLLREVVEVAETAVYSKLRKAGIVVDRMRLALEGAGDKCVFTLWDQGPYVSLTCGYDYIAGQHVDDDDVSCVIVCLWLGEPGQMPRNGGEWVMSGIGLAQELSEFDVFLFDPRHVHSFAKLWGEGAETGLRATVSMYVPNKLVQRVKALVA